MSNKRKLVLGAVGSSVLVVGLLVFGFVRAFSTPAQGVVLASEPSVNPIQQFDLTPKIATGKYATFQFPNAMTVKPNNPLVFPVVEQFNYSFHDIQSWVMSIAVLDIPSGRLMDNNAYQYRKTRPDLYKESTMAIGGADVAVMTNTSAPGFSKVAFLVSGTHSATISLFGDDTLGVANLEKTFAMVLSSWQWQVQ